MTRAEALREANDLIDSHGQDAVFGAHCWNCKPDREYLKDSLYVIHCARGCGRFFYQGVHVAGGQYATD